MTTDTREAARLVQLGAMRRLSPGERVALAVEMSETARTISIEGERRRHPELTEERARDIVFRRMWGSALADRVPAIKFRDP